MTIWTRIVNAIRSIAEAWTHIPSIVEKGRTWKQRFSILCRATSLISIALFLVSGCMLLLGRGKEGLKANEIMVGFAILSAFPFIMGIAIASFISFEWWVKNLFASKDSDKGS